MMTWTALQIKTEPTEEPVTLEEAKRHLRLAVTAGDAADYNEEDDLLTRLITTARRLVEQETGRALITQTREAYFEAWPDGDNLVLPYPPLVSATVTYRLEDDDGYDNTLSTVEADTVSEPGRVVLDPDESWPSETLYPAVPIKVEYVCGYGDPEDVPAGIRAAILLRLSDLYENRGDEVVGVSVGGNLGAAENLLRQYRVRS